MVCVGKFSLLLFCWASLLYAGPDSPSSSSHSSHCKPVYSESGDTFVSAPSSSSLSYLALIDAQLGKLYPGSQYLARGGQSYVYRVSSSGAAEKDRVLIVPLSPLFPRVLESYREQEKLSRMIPDNGRVMRVRKVSEVEGTPVLEADFVPGLTLSEYLESGNGPKSAEAILDVMLEIGRAVVDMHSVSVSHGDVKPLNVKLSAAPGSPDMKATLLDLGLSAQFGQYPLAAERFEDGRAEAVGTSGFIPQEKLDSATPASARDDLAGLSRTYDRVLFPNASKEEATRVINLRSTSSIVDVNPVFGMSPYSIYQEKHGHPPPNYDIVSALAYHYPWSSSQGFVEAHLKAKAALAGKLDFFTGFYGPVLLREMAEKDPARARAIVDTSLELKVRFARNELGLDEAMQKKIRSASLPE